MSDSETFMVAMNLVLSVMAAAAATAALVFAIKGGSKGNANIAEVKVKVEAIRHGINSRMDELLDIAKTLSRLEGVNEGHASGVADEKEDQRQRDIPRESN